MKDRRCIDNLKGFSLVEIVLALGIFSFLLSAIAFFSIDSIKYTKNAQYRVSGGLYMQEVFNAFDYIKKENWGMIRDNTGTGPKHLELVDSMYGLVDGSKNESDISYAIFIESVFRDINGNMVTSGGTEDLHTRRIRLEIGWVDIFGVNRTQESYFFINDWNIPVWVQTTRAEFDTGVFDLMISSDIGDGAIHLAYDTYAYADWCNPNLTISAYDLPGNGVAKGITAIPNKAFAGTGGNASGLSFIEIEIDDNRPPNLNSTSTFDGYKTNDVFGEQNFAYLATDTNSEEILILDIQANPIQKVGFVDLPGSTDGESVFVLNNTGYAIAGSTFYTFDLTSKIGSRPILRSLALGSTAVELSVVENYAYVATTNGNLMIINVTNPSNISITKTYSVGMTAILSSLYVNPTGTRAYVGTRASSAGPEIAIVNIQDKNNPSVITRLEINGMSTTGLTAIQDRLIAVGTGGEEYQVFKLETESSPEKCGGLNIDNGIYGVSSVIYPSNDVFSYIITGDTSNEFKIIKGGLGGAPGSGGASGDYYLESGSFVSEVFDTGFNTADFFVLNWDGKLPPGTSVRIQMRTGNSSDMTGASWFGPDGTSTSYFSLMEPYSIPSIANNKRYVQYKVNMTTTDINATPVLERIAITYSR